MHYRRLSYRYAMVVRSEQPWPPIDLWASDRVRLLVQARWRPDADLYETEETVEIVVDLAGVDEEDFEVQIFDDALVVEGARHLPSRQGTRYHVVGIHQGAFRVELPFPAPIDADRVQARYERGLLGVSVPKRLGAE